MDRLEQWVTRGAEVSERLVSATTQLPPDYIGTEVYCSNLLNAAAVFVPRERSRDPLTFDKLGKDIEAGLQRGHEGVLAEALGGCAHYRLAKDSIILTGARKVIIKCFLDDLAVSSGVYTSGVNLGNVIVTGPKGVGKTSLHVTFAAAAAEATGNVIGLYFNLVNATIIPLDPHTLIAATLLTGGKEWLVPGEDAWLRRAMQVFETPDGAPLPLWLDHKMPDRITLDKELGQKFISKGLGLFLAIDEADVLYHNKMRDETFNRWRAFLTEYVEAPPNVRARGGKIPMSWALTGSGSRLRSHVIEDNDGYRSAEDGGDFRRRMWITNSSKVRIVNISTESSYEEFCGAIRKLAEILNSDLSGSAGPPSTRGSGVPASAGALVEKLGHSRLSDREIDKLLHDRYTAALVYKRSYGNPRMLRGLLEGMMQAALKPAPPEVHEAICCIAEWFLHNDHEAVMSVVDNPFSFRRERFALTTHTILEQNQNRRMVDELTGRRCRVLLEGNQFYDLCDTGYMEPCLVAEDYAMVDKFTVSSASVLFLGLSQVSILKGISNREARLLDALQVDNAGEMLEPTVMRQLVECMERRQSGKAPRTNLFFRGKVSFSGRDPLTWGANPKEYEEGTVDFRVGVKGNVVHGTVRTDFFLTPEKLAKSGAAANEKPDQPGADYVYATFCDPTKNGLCAPRPDMEDGGWTGTELVGGGSKGKPRISKKELWVARFQIRLGKRTHTFGKADAESLTTMLNQGGYVRGSGEELRVGGQDEVNKIFLRGLCGDENPPHCVRVRWFWVLVTSRNVTGPAAKHMKESNVLVWGRTKLWRSLGRFLRVQAAIRGWEKIGYDGPMSLGVLEKKLAEAVGVPKEITDCKSVRARQAAEERAGKTDSDDSGESPPRATRSSRSSVSSTARESKGSSAPRQRKGSSAPRKPKASSSSGE